MGSIGVPATQFFMWWAYSIFSLLYWSQRFMFDSVSCLMVTYVLDCENWRSVQISF